MLVLVLVRVNNDNDIDDDNNDENDNNKIFVANINFFALRFFVLSDLLGRLVTNNNITTTTINNNNNNNINNTKVSKNLSTLVLNFINLLFILKA